LLLKYITFQKIVCQQGPLFIARPGALNMCGPGLTVGPAFLLAAVAAFLPAAVAAFLLAVVTVVAAFLAIL
jgi:hypothetical protein